MIIQTIPFDFSICQLTDYSLVDFSLPYYFIGKTDEEHSLVCPTHRVPSNTIRQDDGWKAFRIQGVLDFSLIGILSKISQILVEKKIGIFVVSTFNTDYVLIKKEMYKTALQSLKENGYQIVDTQS